MYFFTCKGGSSDRARHEPNTRVMTHHAHRARRARRALVGVCIVASMITVPAMHASAAPSHPNLQLGRGGHGHINPVKGAARPKAATSAPKAATGRPKNFTAGEWEYPPQLQNFGGPVIEHVKIVQVLWGAENAGAGNLYLPQVKGSVTPNLGTFFSQVTASSYLDWLNEYDANAMTINRGTFVGRYTITPNVSNNGSTIDDTNIQSELLSQINAGHVPPADADTLYMLFFPSNKVITLTYPQAVYNSIDDFCAYHSSMTTSGPNVRYAVLPDGARRPGACGPDVDWRNMTSATSHEMIEAITDPDGSLATGYDYPIGWYDAGVIPGTASDWGEIGDICNQLQSRVIGTDNVTYTVQRMWSNQAVRCLTTKTITVGDVSIVEGNAGARGLRIPITLSEVSGPSNGDVTVDYTVTGGSATGPAAAGPGVDFGVPGGASGTITFSAASGVTPPRQTLLLMVYGDTNVEGNETFTVTLSNPSNGYSIGRAVGTVTIIDDDATPLPAGKLRSIGIGDGATNYGSNGKHQIPFQLEVSKAVTNAPMVLHWTLHDGTAKFGTDYTGVGGATSGIVIIPANGTGATIYVDIKPNHLQTSTKTFTLSIEPLGGIFALPSWMALTRTVGTGTIFVS